MFFSYLVFLDRVILSYIKASSTVTIIIEFTFKSSISVLKLKLIKLSQSMAKQSHQSIKAHREGLFHYLKDCERVG